LLLRYKKTIRSSNRNITSITPSSSIYKIIKVLLFIALIIESYFILLLFYTVSTSAALRG
ncbi:hypothetical protein COCVIDRAFT_117478, partial [Bipolaris victoriae FI3]